MSGGRSSRNRGNAAEAYVAGLLRAEFYEARGIVLPLQQDAPADLVGLFLGGGWCLYEVKSRKTRARALSARLSPAEQDAFNLLHPTGNYTVIRVLRHPGRPKDTFEVLSRGA